MSFIYGDTKGSLKNRQDFLSALGIDYQDLVCAKQVHKSQIRYVKEDDKGKGALSYDTAFNDTDALITDKKRLPLAIFTADCLPISLYDPKTSAIGLIHAGWRSTQENIARHAVQLIQEKFNSRPEDLYVGFAPAIRQCCYEVKSELNNLFADELIEKDGSYYLDLVGLNKKQLLGSGIKEEHILDCQICTSCQNKNFFSYRREGKNCGRMMSVIMLK
jgi:YfiH family protein